MAFRNRVIRQEVFAQLQRHITALGNVIGVFNGRRNVGKQLGHFCSGFKILLRAVVFWSAAIAQNITIGNTDARFMRFKIFTADEVHIIMCHHANIIFFRQLYRFINEVFFIRAIGAGQGQINPVSKLGNPFFK